MVPDDDLSFLIGRMIAQQQGQSRPSLPELLANPLQSQRVELSVPASPPSQPPFYIKDRKSPLSRRWHPGIYNRLKHDLMNSRGLFRRRIREIVDGRTMPEIAGVPLGGAKRMTAAIMFFDIRNFTGRCASLGNEKSLLVLNCIIPTVMKIIGHWGGEIEKNTGDGVMAIFGTETRDDFLIARDTIEAAMGIKYAMETLVNPFLHERELPSFEFRIGIEMDEVLIARIGFKGTNFLTAVSSGANRASKLQELADSNGICIGRRFFDNLHPVVKPYCAEGNDPSWNWCDPQTGAPYPFFHFNARWPTPEEWVRGYGAWIKQLRENGTL